MRRSVVRLAVAVVTMLALSAGPALAFECYNANRSAQGNASAGANSRALLSLERILADPEIVGLCPAGVEHVIAGLEEQGYRTDVVINFRALMAGGLEGTEKGEAKLHDGRGIDHLSEQFFEDADVLLRGCRRVDRRGVRALRRQLAGARARLVRLASELPRERLWGFVVADVDAATARSVAFAAAALAARQGQWVPWGQ